MARGAVLIALLGALAACEPAPREVGLSMRLPEALGCRPTRVRELEVRALGDFAAQEANLVRFDPGGGSFRIDRFDDRARLLRVRATGEIDRIGGGSDPWEGGAVVEVPDASELRVVPLLRLRRACSLGDPEARVPDGSMALPLLDGRLWIAGGHDARGNVFESTRLVQPGMLLAENGPQRLFVARTEATGTRVDDRTIVVAGGSAAVQGPALDSIEILAVDAEEGARGGQAFLRTPRRAHAAVALGAGRVLITGGRTSTNAPPIADAEVLTVEGLGEAQSTPIGPLAVARAGHLALVLDDGSIVVVGGIGTDEGPVGTVERFVPETRRFEPIGAVPGRPSSAWVALEGARVAQLGGLDADGRWSRRIELLLDGGRTLVELGDALPALEAPVALALGGSRVVVIGRDPTNGRPSGVHLDLVLGTFEPVDPSRLATRLLGLADGTVAEVDGTGVSLLRVDLRTAFDDVPASFVPALDVGLGQLALDGPGRWRAEGSVLVANVDGARIDLPSARFGAFNLEVRGRGSLEILLGNAGEPPVVIAWDESGAGLGTCRIPPAEGPLVVERRPGGVHIALGPASAECARSLPDSVGLAVRASAGSGIERMTVRREP